MSDDGPRGLPDHSVSVRETFGIDSDQVVPAFRSVNEHVPKIDLAYRFDPSTTLAILAGFTYNRRVLLQGYHGTGKSSHVEQVAARLNWPCLRINLDSHISRIDLIGRDAIVIRDGKQITEFREGMLPWALQRSVALVFDEYDAGRADVMFVLQRVLEVDGALTLLDQSRVIAPHPAFRLFGTANTIGLGDPSGIYHGTQLINQGQMDRWHIVARLNYLDPQAELAILHARLPGFDSQWPGLPQAMIALAGLVRDAFMAGEVTTVISPRTVLTWAENTQIFGDPRQAFILSFLNKCDLSEHDTVMELYQRCFGSA